MGRSAAFGLGIFMVFGTMLIGGFLGVLIAFSPHIWYGVYAHETVRYGLTALEDQQLAGTIMWVPSGVAYLAAVLRVMGRWLFAMEALENPGPRRV
jgi:putative membrane protein